LWGIRGFWFVAVLVRLGDRCPSGRGAVGDGLVSIYARSGRRATEGHGAGLIRAIRVVAGAFIGTGPGQHPGGRVFMGYEAAGVGGANAFFGRRFSRHWIDDREMRRIEDGLVWADVRGVKAVRDRVGFSHAPVLGSEARRILMAYRGKSGPGHDRFSEYGTSCQCPRHRPMVGFPGG
jgi:hypothetical protein